MSRKATHSNANGLNTNGISAEKPVHNDKSIRTTRDATAFFPFGAYETKRDWEGIGRWLEENDKMLELPQQFRADGTRSRAIL